MQRVAHMRREGLRRHLRAAPHAHKAVVPSLRVRAVRMQHRNIRQAEPPCKAVVHAAGRAVEIRVGVERGNAVFDQKQQVSPRLGRVVHGRKRPDRRVMRQQQLRTDLLGLPAGIGKGVERD